MNDKTTFLGYSQNIGLTSNASTTLTTNSNGVNITYANGIWATPLTGGSHSNGIDYNSILTLITNQNNMVKQVKVAVFTVERNEDNKVTSAKFINELWVEVKNGTSLELSVAKQLDKDFDPETTVIREIHVCMF